MRSPGGCHDWGGGAQFGGYSHQAAAAAPPSGAEVRTYLTTCRSPSAHAPGKIKRPSVPAGVLSREGCRQPPPWTAAPIRAQALLAASVAPASAGAEGIFPTTAAT